MTKRILWAVTAAGCLLAQAPSFEGNWQGTLEAGPVKYRLGLHITRTQEGKVASTLDSIDQGAMGIPVEGTTVSGNSLRLDMPGLQAKFEGKLSEGGESIEGTFTQGAALPLVWKRAATAAAAPARPQTPKPPFPYASEEVSYQNKAAGITLAGTLTLPRGNRPFPAVILITGSGTHDRDETLFGHKPFLVIADYLTRRGIAVLRVDDRGAGSSTGSKSTSTIPDMAGDVLAGIAYLKGRGEIDGRRIGLIGHSEGAEIGPYAASQSPDVAFVVLLAGPGVPGDELLRKQAELVIRAQGGGEAAVAQNRVVQDAMLKIIKEEKDPAAAGERIRAAFKELAPGTPEGAVTANSHVTAELRSIVTYDPAPALHTLKMPVLALNGARDVQVSSTQNLPAISSALKAAANPDFIVTELPRLNHLFQTCQTCTVAEYGALEETFAPAALQMMGDWITRHAAAPAAQ